MYVFLSSPEDMLIEMRRERERTLMLREKYQWTASRMHPNSQLQIESAAQGCVLTGSNLQLSGVREDAPTNLATQQEL